MKAIETHYKGYRFRSRLEARWAVFFDALGIEWEYEKEGYDLGGAGLYLPDFFCRFHAEWREFSEWPDPGRFFEIKPIPPTQEEINKLSALESYTKHHARFLIGVPGNHRVFFSNGGEFVFELCCVDGDQCEDINSIATLDLTLHQLSAVHTISTRHAITLARSARFEFGESGT